MVELILVMTIMAIVGLFAAMAIGNIHDQAKRQETEATIKLMETALDVHKHDMGVYPNGDATMMITRLTHPSVGWNQAGMHWFKNKEAIVDGWGMPFSYIVHFQYNGDGRLTDDNGDPRPIGVERTPGKADYYNPFTYQIYSMGSNMKTWPPGPDLDDFETGQEPRLCGTEEDDIRNWKHESYWLPAHYDALP
jgi:type II secretory pathway pseudopilin PulG